MKITVIGHWGAYPEKDEATSCYLLEHASYKLLIDCGSGSLSQLQHFCKLEELDAVILSHYHHDHIADVGPLQYSRMIAKQLNKTNKDLIIYGHAYDQAQFQKLAKPPYVKSTIFNEKSNLKIGPFSVSFFETNHKARCFAMRFEVDGKSLVYSADSSYMESFETFAKSADIFICESSFYAHQNAKPSGHMNSKEAGTIALNANVDTLVLSHLPHFGDHQKLISESMSIFNGEVLLAKKGLVLQL